MKKLNRSLRRLGFGGSALLLLVGVAAPALLLPHSVSAAQVTARSITLSSSRPGQTAVTYNVTFTPATAAQEVIVDFCANTPIPGDSCTATAGTDVPDVTSVAGPATTAAVGSSNKHTVKITGQTLAAGTPKTFTLTGITNPTNVSTGAQPGLGSFYARIFTYTTGGAASYAPANGAVPTEGSYVDYGGIALSTATVVNITAKVMETLSFCVYAGTGSCGTSPDFTIGAGPNNTLNTTLATANTKFDVSTNAKSGVSVKLKGDTLKNGAYAFASPSTSTPTAIAAGAEGFGLSVSTPGGLTATSPYNGTTTTFALDTNGTTGVTSTYGQEVAKSTGVVNASTSTITWGAQASNVTPAGIYTATEQLIATGTF